MTLLQAEGITFVFVSICLKWLKIIFYIEQIKKSKSLSSIKDLYSVVCVHTLGIE
jgi:hypothetical protein